ncbi:MAG: peroxiredoxin [Gemmatimonadota bacterium]|nr:peroxiredoxin [Gemmatimonadota bacterium]
MTVRIGDDAPNFTAETTQGRVNFYDWKGNSWAILFSHPRDFTPVCTTELGTVAKLMPEFAARNTKVIGLSVDPVESHHTWEKDIGEVMGTAVNFPMIADPDRTVSTLYDMIHPNASDTATVRSVFIIGPDNKVKLSLTYPASAGRNFDEVMRVLDALQLSAKFPVATPANWRPGQDVIVALSMSTEEARAKFPKGVTEVKSYLRTTPNP